MIQQINSPSPDTNNQYKYTITKPKQNNVTTLNTQLHIIKSASSHPASEQELQQLQNSQYRLRPISSHRNVEDDYVELPKIDFSSPSSRYKNRKASEVVINLPEIQSENQSQINIKTNYKGTDQNDSSDYEQIDDQKSEWANCNINNLKVLTSHNNYLQLQDSVIPGSSGQMRKRMRKNSRQYQRQLQRRQRQRNMELVNNFLSGKASMVWLFVLGPDIRQQQIQSVKAVYSEYVEYQYEVPLCRSYEQACKFLNLENCFFKVVVDLDLSQHFLEENNANKNVASIYIYNPKRIEGINRAFELKKNLKKIKGMYNDLKQVTKQAQDDLQNQAKFVKIGDQIQRQRNKLRFPSFYILTGADSTDVTNYRLCLFGALKLAERKERQTYLKEFTDMVELRYKDVKKELENLKQYQKIDHIGSNSPKKMKQVLQFYVRQTFYYVLTNSILRLSRNSQEFRPCTIPFNQTYHAIKHYYKMMRDQPFGKKNIPEIVVYRGAKLRNSDIKALEVGSYIQLLGFTSTSLKRAEAEKFMDGDSYLFEIHIDLGAQNDEEMTYDHGYVQINKYDIASKAFHKEQQVLINALNVFQVTEIDCISTTRKITMRYGAILPLLRTKSSQLSHHDRAVVQNYKYCLQTFHQIQDDGDVLLIAQEHDRCVEYYQNKVEQNGGDFKVLGKLAHAQLESGDLDEAYNNALKSLEKLQNNSKDDKEIQKTVNQLQKNVEIFDVKQDMVHYNNSIDICLQMMKEDWLESARLLKQKAAKSLKAGDNASCKLDLQKSKAIIEEKQASFAMRKKQVQRRYRIRAICCGCTRAASDQLEEQKQSQLLKIEQDEIQFQRKRDEMHELYVEINAVSKNLAQVICDKQMYQECIESGQKHFNDMRKQPLNPIQEARVNALQASVVDKHSKLAQFQKKMEKAIGLVKKQDPFHRHIGTYSNILGDERQACMKRKLQLSPIQKHPLSNQNVIEQDYQPMPDQRQNTDRYNYEQSQTMRNKIKSSYKEAAENIAYNYGKQHPDYLSVRNKICEVELDCSKLEESQQMLKQTKQFKLVNFHSQGSRCFLLLAKISLAKGQLKNAFQNVEQSYTILRNTLLKVDNKAYNQVFVNNPLYIEINLNRAKIYNRQLKHDIALKELKVLKKVAELRRDRHHSSSLLASVFEEQAQIQLCSGEMQSFEDKILEAISIRQAQMGKYNIHNAVAYSNLFKFMENLNDHETAMKYHLQATQIFSRFPADHPNFWIIHLANALLFFKDQEHQKCTQQLQSCLKITNLRYSTSHIITLKVDFQYANMLQKMSKITRSMQMYKNIEEVIVECLKKKQAQGDKIQKETDDQKFPLLKKVYNEMKDIHTISQRQIGNNSQIQLQRYSNQLKNMNHIMGSESTAMIKSENLTHDKNNNN